jgi:RimJ/RimL family protein N-acetyltransferase
MFEYQPQLTGKMVALRPLAAEDWAPLFALAADREAWAMHPQSDRYQEPIFRALFEEALACGGTLVALDRETGAVIGWSRYSADYALPGEIEIGWTFLGRAYWGGAYNTDMKHLMLRHAFRFVETVIFRIGSENLRSRRAVEKLGARLTDRAETSAARGFEWISVYYAISRRDFEAKTAGLIDVIN